MTARFDSVGACVDELLARRGRRIRIGTPLGLGTASLVMNELYRRAKEDPRLDLTIETALDLVAPSGRSELESRLVDPLAERLFGGYPEPAWASEARRGRVPDNVTIRSFYFTPGATLGSAALQQQHRSVNYSDVVDSLAHSGVDTVAQLVAPGDDGSYSLSSNPDIGLDLLDRIGRDRLLVVGEVNRNLPYMFGDAAVPAELFDLIVDVPLPHFRLVGPPKEPVGFAEHAIGLRAASLVRDGGTLQIGIGDLGDALVWHLLCRHRRTDEWRALADAVGTTAPELTAIGGFGPFGEGLYGNSEMLADGFLELLDAGVLQRSVDPGDVLVHAAFFLGPPAFYERLCNLDEATRRRIAMSRISFTNTLGGDHSSKVSQRRHARHVNTAMKVTLLGAAASDGLEGGKVVSGVGGQFDFVRMAHELPGARSILCCPAVRDRGRPESNIVWSYGHCTIPRHLRDLVVTEYGVADLRGRSDADVVAALLDVADSRFQEQLRREAVDAGKLPASHEIASRHRQNTPEGLRRRLAGHESLLPELPFGSDLTREEIVLGRALRHLQQMAGSRGRRLQLSKRTALAAVRPPETIRPYLQRLELDHPTSISERVQARLVAYALAATGAIDPDGDSVRG